MTSPPGSRRQRSGVQMGRAIWKDWSRSGVLCLTRSDGVGDDVVLDANKVSKSQSFTIIIW